MKQEKDYSEFDNDPTFGPVPKGGERFGKFLLPIILAAWALYAIDLLFF
jgi:hypothetical protein